MAHFIGTWKRYKVENEEDMFKMLGTHQFYESMKDVEVTITITKKDDKTFAEALKRGVFELNQEVSTGGGDTDLTLEDGTKIKVNPVFNADFTCLSYEFDYKGIHRKHTREMKGTDMVQTDDFHNGKTVSVSYFKKA